MSIAYSWKDRKRKHKCCCAQGKTVRWAAIFKGFLVSMFFLLLIYMFISSVAGMQVNNTREFYILPSMVLRYKD